MSYEDVGREIGALVDEKNRAYGNSFNMAGEVLKILYPKGLQPEQYPDMLAVVRILDKLFRIATKKDAFGESPFRDIAGYGLLGAVRHDEEVCGPEDGANGEHAIPPGVLIGKRGDSFVDQPTPEQVAQWMKERLAETPPLPDGAETEDRWEEDYQGIPPSRDANQADEDHDPF